MKDAEIFRDLYGDYFKDELSNLHFFTTVRQMGLSSKELLNIFGKAFVESHVLAAKKNGKKRWADKNPENVLYLDEWTKLLEEKFFFILLIRNPLDTLASLKEANFSKTLPSGFEALVNIYQKYTDSGLKFAKHHNDTSIIIQYENLVSGTTTTIKELMNFIGEKYESSMIKSYNSTKRKSGIEDPKVKLTNSIHSKSIGRWENDLTSGEVAYISKKCKNIFTRFNYNLP
ncbi:MAG: hypothetical protein B6D64_10155 [Bacteroidetes bacterium 4484_276]|nr:MAG: hypothetical protein B6D64_10155 [Bacteroidetes bacterium 4484_276]